MGTPLVDGNRTTIYYRDEGFAYVLQPDDRIIDHVLAQPKGFDVRAYLDQLLAQNDPRITVRYLQPAGAWPS